MLFLLFKSFFNSLYAMIMNKIISPIFCFFLVFCLGCKDQKENTYVITKAKLPPIEANSFVLTPLEFESEDRERHNLLKHAGVNTFRKFQIDFQTNKKLFALWAEVSIDDEFTYHSLIIPQDFVTKNGLGRQRFIVELSICLLYTSDAADE